MNNETDAPKDAYEAFLEELNANLEKAVLTRIEEIEGRVPANHEVRLYGKKIAQADGGQEIFWRNRPVAKLIAPKPEDPKQEWKISIVRDEA